MVRPDGEMDERNGMDGMGGIDRAWRAWRCWQRPHGPNDGGWAGTAREYSHLIYCKGFLLYYASNCNWPNDEYVSREELLSPATSTSAPYSRYWCERICIPYYVFSSTST
jgi:hypothetical protein